MKGRAPRPGETCRECGHLIPSWEWVYTIQIGSQKKEVCIDCWRDRNADARA